MLKLLKPNIWLRISADKFFKYKSNIAKSIPAELHSAFNFHTCSQFNAKIFMDKENDHAHTILAKSSNYNLCHQLHLSDETKSIQNVSDILTQPLQSPAEAYRALETIVKYCKAANLCITGEKFDSFVATFTDQCHKLSEDQLLNSLRLLKHLPASSGVNSHNFVDLWEALDHACVRRLDTWKTDEILLVCDCWYGLNLAKCSECVWEGIKKIGRKARKLTPQQLVHTIFFCNIVRKPLLDMYALESRFNGLVDSLSLDEVGVVCMGFFKTQTVIHNPELIEKLYRRLIDNLDTVEDITLVNFIKILRYSSKILQADIMNELLEKICPRIDRISLLACLHVALTGCDIQMCHEKSVRLILERFNRNIDEARIKDMERICHVMGLFNVETESGVEKELCTKILSNLHTRIDEIIRYPKCFQACLHYLSLCGHYDAELISAALDPKFIKHVSGKNLLLGREVFCLDSFARINLKDSYKGNLLSDKQRRTMGKLLTHYIPEKNSKFKLNVTDRILVDVRETCKDIYGASNLKHVLPHYQRPDIVISYDIKSKRGLVLNELCPEDYCGKILELSDIAGDATENIQTFVVIVGGWNNIVRNTNKPTGLLQMKMTQLKILGYRVAMIPWYEWREQNTTSDKCNYVRQKLAPVF